MNLVCIIQSFNSVSPNFILITVTSSFFQTSVPAEISEKFKACSFLPNPDFPLIFQETFGIEQLESWSNTYYNVGEAIMVSDWAVKLFQYTSDIGIITPYAIQEKEIKRYLQQMLGEVSAQIKVGSVEKFQGDEKSVIIVSTVRSSENPPKKEAVAKSGFLCDPNHINFAIPRAVSLLLIVGCPYKLMADRLVILR